jgi:hypothetical protein
MITENQSHFFASTKMIIFVFPDRLGLPALPEVGPVRLGAAFVRRHLEGPAAAAATGIQEPILQSRFTTPAL